MSKPVSFTCLILPGAESADFFALMKSDRKNIFIVADTKFISGSNKMKLEGWH